MPYNKYKNKKVAIDNITFDSLKEGARYQELKLLLKAGEISNLELQPTYVLQAPFKRQGSIVRALTYKADFRYLDKEKRVVVEDVKGHKAEVYKIKKKILLYKFGQEIDIFLET